MNTHRLTVLSAASLLVALFSATASAAIIAQFDFEAGGSGNMFDNGDLGLFSVDTEPFSTVSRLQSSGVDGGGANNIFNFGQPNAGTGPSRSPSCRKPTSLISDPRCGLDTFPSPPIV